MHDYAASLRSLLLSDTSLNARIMLVSRNLLLFRSSLMHLCLCSMQVFHALAAQIVRDSGPLRVTGQGIPVSCQPEALHVLLGQVTSMYADGISVWLQSWDWPAVAGAVARFNQWENIGLGVHEEGPLTDDLLRVVMRMGARVRRVRTTHLALQSDHSSATWPWSHIILKRADVAQLPRLPCPGAGALIAVETLSSTLSASATMVSPCKTSSTAHALCTDPFEKHRSTTRV